MGTKRPKSLKQLFKTRYYLQYTKESEAKKINKEIGIELVGCTAQNS